MVKQVSEFEQEELFDPSSIAALIDKSKEEVAETNKKINKKNFAIGSVIIMILSIPIIIFSVNIIDASKEMVRAQLIILTGILCFFLSITPWVSAACIKLALQNK